jgi:hypothetical protein
MTYLISGNCHAHQIASSLELMTGKTSGVIREPNSYSPDRPEHAEMCSRLDKAEHVGVISTFLKDFRSVFPQYAQKASPIPHVYTAAFHPDILEFSAGGKRIISAMETSHSRLVLFGYLNDLGIDRTIELFSPDVYTSLGYLNGWKLALAWAEEQSALTGWDVAGLYRRWLAQGCFVHTPNHPKLHVLADLASEFAWRNGVEIVMPHARDMQMDKAASHSIWPVYPGIAETFGLRGSLRFKIVSKGQNIWIDKNLTISLKDFVSASFDLYAGMERESLPTVTFETETWKKLRASIERRTNRKSETNPYSGLPDTNYWRRAISSVEAKDVDPVVEAKFRILATDNVATAGSCFAQHISRTLSATGCNYFVAETAPDEMSIDEAQARNYGTFSARFGNIYTTRQMVQLFKRAYGKHFPAVTHFKDANGHFIDPWRPLVEPGGFDTFEALEADQKYHLAAVRRMFEQADVLVFTLGLTEGWRAKPDQSVFPVVPGAVSPGVNPDEYEFFNMTADEVLADLEELYSLVMGVNTNLRIVLTVSPVPLIATYSKKHVLTATTYSKSVLRVAADQMEHRHANVMYFPSYEIITGSFNRGRYFEPDLRGVRPEGVDHVMRLFMKHCLVRNEEHDLAEARANAMIVCDEEILD